jgi:hypothetical protein
MSNAGGMSTVTRYTDMLAGNPVFVDADFQSIETVTVGVGGQAAVTFSSIPQSFKHLQIRAITRNNGANTQQAFPVNFNADSGANYAAHYLQTNPPSGVIAGGGVSSSINWIYAVGSSTTAGIFNPTIIDILDYQNTNKYKTVRTFNGWDFNSGGYISYASGSWRNFDAINSITFSHASNFSQYSQFALYGIRG